MDAPFRRPVGPQIRLLACYVEVIIADVSNESIWDRLRPVYQESAAVLGTAACFPLRQRELRYHLSVC
jgi:hypothetical protein